MRFSYTEVKHLIIAWLTISLAFTFLFIRGFIFRGVFDPFPLIFLISLGTVGISFVIHELLHKIIAQRYGMWAEFRMDVSMLVFAVLLSLAVGIVFAAPGAVYIFGRLTKEQNGKISLAGPVSNLILAWLFLSLDIGYGLSGMIGEIGSKINAMFAFFNLLPFGILDGRKVFEWNRGIYLLAMALSILTIVVVI